MSPTFRVPWKRYALALCALGGMWGCVNSGNGTSPGSNSPVMVQFFVTNAVLPGNPALVQVTTRSQVSFTGFVSVFDPEFVDDQKTQMTARYRVVGIPEGARVEDVSLDRDFDTLSNQGRGDNSGTYGQVGIYIRGNPDREYEALTATGELIKQTGVVVPGAYTFRVIVTNPNGQVAERDLVVNVVHESIDGVIDGPFFSQGQGLNAMAVKQLPGGVTDKVLSPTQTVQMVVTVFPAVATRYQFMLVDDNNTMVFDSVTQSATQVAGGATPTDITLTIGSSSGLPTGTLSLWVDAYDNKGANNLMTVRANATAETSGGTPIRFHVTKDSQMGPTVNGALVGRASNLFNAAVDYEGWNTNPGFGGPLAALADLNGDGMNEIVALNGSTLIAAYGYTGPGPHRQAINSQLFDNSFSGNVNLGVAAAFTPRSMAVGDLNGDGLPDVAVAGVTGGVGQVQVFFHTGNKGAPYSSSSTDHQLFIYAPVYQQRLYQDQDNPTVVSTSNPVNNPATNSRADFAWRIAIANVTGDDAPDLIVTDPGFSKLKVHTQAGPRPAAFDTFALTHSGRVYVFAGGPAGKLQGTRPDMVTSLVAESAIYDTTPTVMPVSVAFSESDVNYTVAAEGGQLEYAGHVLAAANGLFAVGSPVAPGDGRPNTTQTFSLAGGNIPDGAYALTLYGGIARYYEFDTSVAPALGIGGAVRVDISAAGATAPSEALKKLRDAINADADRLVDVAEVPTATFANPVNGQVTLSFTGVGGAFGAADTQARLDTGMGNAYVYFNNVAGVFTTNFMYPAWDGVVSRFNGSALSAQVKGTANSNMGLGASLAIGNINGNGGINDLAIGALDSGDPRGRNNGPTLSTGLAPIIDSNDDGAVFIVMDGATTLPAAQMAGANTLYGITTEVLPTETGGAIGVGDVNGDGLDDVIATEPGFDRIHIFHGAATPTVTPNVTFTNVSLLPSNYTSVLVGDMNGDGSNDWMSLRQSFAFGIADFKRGSTN